MARIEGTGIKEPSKDAKVANLNFLRNPKKFLQDKIDKKLDSYTKSGKTPFGTSIGGSAVGEEGLGRFGNPNELSDARPNFFSPSGGAFDERNNVQIASANLSSLDVGDSFTKQAESNLADTKVAIGESGFTTSSDTSFLDKDADFNEFKKTYGGYYEGFPGRIKKDIKLDYLDKNPTKYQEFLNKAPVQEKPSFVERTKNLAGSIFNTVTGTQPAAASQIPGGMPTGTQFTSSNLDAAKAPTGDTSFASYRMAGQPSGGEQQQGSGIVTPFSQTSMGKGEDRKVTPFSETSMGKGEPVKVTPFRQTSMGNKTVTVDGQKVAARQTVASLPSDYKQTEAREFAKAAAFQQAKKNPNVTVGVDSKGQPVAKAVQKSRTEAGASAKTAEGNKARVRQNAKAKAQAAAFNRKMSGKSISQTKAANQASMRQRASERNKAFQAAKKAGTLSKSARTAAGQRARNKAAAKARAKAAAKRRRSKKKGKKCDIFLKYNISPLTNMNLIRDDLAEVAYFVKELQA